MAIGPWRAANQHVERLFTTGGVAGLTEAQLVDRFVARRDEAAFEAIVTRHGPMVLTVCRRLLRDPNDVDDAFQATFLVFMRKASSLRNRDLLGNWLYGVAWRVAMRARAIAASRPREPGDVLDGLPSRDGADPSDELRRWIHEEVARLPERYRAPVVLCYLEGATHEEAAQRLGWPVGTVKGRLARARDQLRTRLGRRGLTASGAVALLAEFPQEAPAAVPAAVVASTVHTAGLVSAHATPAVAGSVLTLAEGVISTMSLAKLKSAGIILSVAAGVVISGVGVGALRSQEHPRDGRAGAAPVTAKGKASAEKSTFKTATGTPPASVAAQDVLNAERTTFDRLLAAYRPGSLSGLMNLHEWSERMLRSHLDATQDPALRAAALAAHAQRMDALAIQEDAFAVENLGPGGDTTANVARTFALTAHYRLASAQPNPAAAVPMMGGSGGMAGMGMGGGAMAGMGMGGGGIGGMGMMGLAGDVDGRFTGRTPAEARLLERIIAQSQARHEIAATAARLKKTDPANERILKKLDAPVSMSFAVETPFEDVLKYIKSATQGAADSGIPIYIDPEGLTLADKTMQSPIVMDLEGVPLKFSLRLLLRQLGLSYCVKDGMLMISTPEIILEELKEVEQLMENEGGKQ